MKNKRAEHALPVMPCACGSVRRAARATTQLYDRALRPSGLNTAQFTLLQTLEQAGPLTQGRLGDVLALDSTTLSRTLRPLEARRWVRLGGTGEVGPVTLVPALANAIFAATGRRVRSLPLGFRLA